MEDDFYKDELEKEVGSFVNFALKKIPNESGQQEHLLWLFNDYIYKKRNGLLPVKE